MCDAGAHTFTILFGNLELPAGGLSVAGSVYSRAVSLGPGQSVSW